jgi:hypothetical protein
LRIFFDLAGEERWHRREWEHQLAAMAGGAGPEARLVSARPEADCVITSTSPWNFGAGGKILGRRPPCGPGTPPVFVWDYCDLPAGRDPGFYCSLPRPLFDPRRHRSTCYPIRYNECVCPGDLGEARFLFGFMGGITSGLRARLVASLRSQTRPGEMQLVVSAGPWSQMFDRSGIPLKQQYAQALRESRFFLCPRGNGVGSVRLFETMQAARVPVIISDDYVPPAGIAWDSCSVRVRERDVVRLPALLRARDGDWPRLAANARRVWEEHFSDFALLVRLARDLRELMAADSGEKLPHLARLGVYWARARAPRRLLRFARGR